MNNKDVKNKYYKPQRLKGFDYKGLYCYSLILCTHNRIPFLKSENVVIYLKSRLMKISEDFKFDIICYCFMPDHLHILIQGKNDNSDLKKFIKCFKQKTGYEFKKKTNKQLWQSSFYDHIVRGDENLYNACKYIIENPVRTGLVEDYRKHPFSWCKYFDVRTGELYL